MNDESQAVPVENEDENEITAELEPAELEREWDKLAERAKEIRAVLKLGARTDLGRVRENNEDKFDFFEPEDPDVLARKGSLYAVADGMGGHAAGQIASEMALKTAIRSYYADPSEDVVGSLRRAVFEANALIYDASHAIVERSGMGTTFTGVAIRADEAYFCQVGDSRAYLMREGGIRQITEDHSWVAEQVSRGALTEEEARFSPFRNVITRSLGNMPTVEPDIFVEELKPGDTIILCTDGLSGNLSADEILALASGKGPSEAAMDLVDAANEKGGTDNITALVLAVKEILREEGQSEEPKRKGLFGLFR